MTQLPGADAWLVVQVTPSVEYSASRLTDGSGAPGA